MRKSTQEALSMEYDISMFKRKPLFDFTKRLFDIFASIILMIIISPLLIILSILVKVTSKGPIIYKHMRVGKNGKMFPVYKFRSMKCDDRPLEEILSKEQLDEYNKEFKVTNDPRITPLGRFLRKTSLDELPQLLNILKGDMSFVGWRPILEKELELYGKNKELLLKVKPGLTGYWASHGRSEILYENRIKMELYYVIKRNIWLDIRIYWHTVFKVAKHEGAE